MKARLIILFSLLLALNFVLFSAPAELDIRMFDDGNMIVIIDDFECNENTGRYHIAGLTPGYNEIDVYRVMYNLQNEAYAQHFYSGEIYIQDGYLTYAEVQRGGKLVILRKELLTPEPDYYNSGNNYGNNYGNNSYNNNGNQYGQYSGGGGYYGHGDNYNHSGGNYGYGGYSYGMDQYAFAELKRTIASASYDSKRLDFAKFVVSQNRLSSAQVSELVTLFSFESNKLEFAKFAYAYVADPGSYFMVANAFSFISSKRELFDFIGYGSRY